MILLRLCKIGIFQHAIFSLLPEDIIILSEGYNERRGNGLSKTKVIGYLSGMLMT